ncbi:MAG: GTP-binding protein [Candidatus Heimdallarchaeota archaeon]|nr:MAG: GTP-binding protein [Candidatus Heimdallarchaeota archaeon]
MCLSSWISKILSRKKKKDIRLAFYGEINAGKTTLANRIANDLGHEDLGPVSEIPHETRKVVKLENARLKKDGYEINFTLMDMPGIATTVDYRNFVKFGLTESEAIQRAKEATKGILEAIKMIDQVDVALVILDSTKTPFEQVNLTIIGNLQLQKIPIIIIANKTDLPDSRPELVRQTFSDQKIVAVSAKTGDNVSALYEAIRKMS